MEINSEGDSLSPLSMPVARNVNKQEKGSKTQDMLSTVIMRIGEDAMLVQLCGVCLV